MTYLPFILVLIRFFSFFPVFFFFFFSVSLLPQFFSFLLQNLLLDENEDLKAIGINLGLISSVWCWLYHWFGNGYRKFGNLGMGIGNLRIWVLQNSNWSVVADIGLIRINSIINWRHPSYSTTLWLATWAFKRNPELGSGRWVDAGAAGRSGIDWARERGESRELDIN